MPSYPRIDKGEGLVRTHDLLEELQSDVWLAYESLDGNKESQYLRRCVVRAIFSFIEACIETIKVEIRSNIRTGFCTPMLTEKEKETLGSLYVIGGRWGDKRLPLDANIKRTFRLAAKVWGLADYKLSTGGEDFKDFKSSKDARNCLTHPRTFYDIQVTDDDMRCHSSTYHWVLGEFGTLFRKRVEALVASLPPKDGELLLRSVGMGHQQDGA